jgi:hypothetical protein
VEARFTVQAVLKATETPPPPAETPTPALVNTATSSAPIDLPASTADPNQPATGANGKACYTMTFLGDVSIPDGMIVSPGAKFTKTWRVRNDGNCVWDQNYSLELKQGDAMTTATKIPLTKKVYPGDSYDISIEMTAPTTEGIYFGYWHIATPYGGYMGVAGYNQALFVKVHVTAKSERYFGVDNVVYDITRKPATGCGSDGAVYYFTATITANGPGEVDYRWAYQPWDGDFVTGHLKFDAAGSKTVYWQWRMTNGHIQNIDRWVGIVTTVGSQETAFGRVKFHFTCNQ